MTIRSRPLRRPVTVTLIVPHFVGFARCRANRPPLTLYIARCTTHAVLITQRGGSHGPPDFFSAMVITPDGGGSSM
jgi:hypothetical protein